MTLLGYCCVATLWLSCLLRPWNRPSGNRWRVHKSFHAAPVSSTLLQMCKTCATSKSTRQYYTPKCLINYLLSNFFFCQVFLLIFHKAGKVKRLEKRNACSRPVKQVIFLVQNNQLYNIAGYLKIKSKFKISFQLLPVNWKSSVSWFWNCYF